MLSSLESKSENRPRALADYCRESRHDAVQRLAYEHWEQRGHPLGSPDIDWFEAEDAVRSYLLASGVELGPGGNLYR
jgi:hypothetical protein